MKQKVLGFLIFLIYRVLSATWRVTITQPESLTQAVKNRKPYLLAHWHGDELVLLSIVRHYGVVTIVSQSKDGAMMDFIFRRMGGFTVRGSSTRGGIGALKGLIRMSRAGYPSSFAVDGPKGPIYQVKPGIFEVSRVLNLAIYWAGIHCDRAIHFPKSWNKTYLPKPFAKIRIQWFGPMNPIGENEDPRSPEIARTLGDALNAAKQQVAGSIAEPGIGC